MISRKNSGLCLGDLGGGAGGPLDDNDEVSTRREPADGEWPTVAAVKGVEADGRGAEPRGDGTTATAGGLVFSVDTDDDRPLPVCADNEAAAAEAEG